MRRAQSNTKRLTFLIPRGKEYLGVEVTEAFLSESHARMEVLPNYFGELVKHRKYRHKKDKDIYHVKRVHYTAQDGTPVDAIGVASVKPDSKERFARLADVIAAKSARLNDYLLKCTAVDLIIRDRGVFSENVTKEQIPQIFNRKEIREFVQTSGFREILYVAQASGGVYFSFPVRTGILAAEVFAFLNALGQGAPDSTPKEAFGALTLHLANRGFRSVGVVEQESDRFSIVCDAAAASLEVANRQICIHDLFSDSAKALRSAQMSTSSLVEGKSLLDRISQELATGSYSVDLAREISLPD